MNKYFLLLASLLLITSCKHEINVALDIALEDQITLAAPTGQLSDFILPSGDNLDELPNQDLKNPLSFTKIALGRMLFFETGIALVPKHGAGKQTYSCASCHIPEEAYLPGRFQGLADGAYGFGQSGEGRFRHEAYEGIEVDAQGARPLTLHNATYVTNALWAGNFGSFGVNTGTEAVWNQDTLIAINFEGLEGLEANNIRALQVHRMIVNKDITDSLGYTALFDASFPEVPAAQRYSLRTTAFAIAAYFRSILTNQAPFQYWLKGDKTAMTDTQKRGATLFFGEAGCVGCHNSPSLNSMTFHALGVKDLGQNPDFEVMGKPDKRPLGRGGFTGRSEDLYKFKTPQLYNLKNAKFYFHGASKRSLREVVEYFNTGQSENPDVPTSQLSNFIAPLQLSDQDVTDIAEFLENGLYDPNIKRYEPIRIASNKCFPNNDPVSQEDLGCE